MAVQHTIKARDGGEIVIDDLTRGLAIHLQCTECMGDDHPRNCTSTRCPLFPYRGKTRRGYHSQDVAINDQDDETEFEGEYEDDEEIVF